MDALTHCPKCKDPLLNSLVPNRGNREFWLKCCDKHLGHKFALTTDPEDNNKVWIAELWIDRNKQIKAIFDVRLKKIFISKKHSSRDYQLDMQANQIPWFEPNVMDYDNLINKLKLYLTFL